MKYFFLCLFLFATSVKAQEYVLPYPGPMPGNKMYTLMAVVDKFQEFWHWGSIAKFRYHIALADKYIIEAKTLYEYKQYLLATDALRRSNQQFARVSSWLVAGVEEGKDMSQYFQQMNLAAIAHQKLLSDLYQRVPSKYIWSPEQTAATELDLHTELGQSVKLRIETAQQLLRYTRCLNRLYLSDTRIKEQSQTCWFEKDVPHELIPDNVPYM